MYKRQEPGKWREGLCNLEFVMVTDLFMTPTAMACGDLFLPLAMFPEQDAVVSNHYCGTPTITGVINKAYSVGECKSDFEYTFELGKMLRPEAWEGQDTLEDWINAYGLWTLPVDFEYMREHVYYRRKVGYYKYETGELRADGEPGFETFTHRLELFSLVLQNYGEDPLPYYPMCIRDRTSSTRSPTSGGATCMPRSTSASRTSAGLQRSSWRSWRWRPWCWGRRCRVT